MTARDGLATPIQDAQQQLADALADILVAHAQLESRSHLHHYKEETQ